MFIVTEQMRLRLRKEVQDIMKGERLGVRGLDLPAYLGGDGVPLGKQLRAVQSLLNPIDPEPYKRGDLTPKIAHTTGDTDEPSGKEGGAAPLSS